ncbi:beta strand repeat-containing protein, partial [Pedobacter sandarakinus]|uniref:beta strand repeat-containing protein n=1 Tax=Pedobacter sandarakinus TaxID=353156 RepID=UPI0038995F84|nr:hypothetical protein [Pedobacter sandarakinus]
GATGATGAVGPQGGIGLIEDGNNTTVSGSGVTGNAYKVNVATANGTTIGVVKEAATNPTVSVNNGELSVNTATLGKNISTTNGAIALTGNTGATLTDVTLAVKANNGLAVANDNVQLGGDLTKPTVINVTTGNSLGLTGLSTGTAGTDKVIVSDPTTGVLKTIDQSTLNANNWLLNGNVGTNASTNFLGTTDAIDLIIKTNSIQRMRVTADGNIDIPNSTATTAIITKGGAPFIHNNGDESTAVGTNALNLAATGRRNDAFGVSALTSVTSGIQNTAIGRYTLRSLTIGNDNVAMGNRTLENLTDGSTNIAIGRSVMPGLVTGTGNISIGTASALQIKPGAISNTVIGTQAGGSTGFGAGIGSGNVLLGYRVGWAHTGDNRLMIDNSETNTPLLDGDFTTRILTINNTLKVADLATGATTTTGNRPVVAGPDGQLRIGTSAATVTADNGLTKTGDNIALGGILTQATTITTAGASTLAIAGLQAGTVGTDKVIVSDPTTGVLKTLDQSAFNKTNWQLTGNAGTDETVNFLGTTDDQRLIFKVDNKYAGLVDRTITGAYFTAFGYQAGESQITTMLAGLGGYGSHNTVYGYQAGKSNMGVSNAFVGAVAGMNNTSGSDNAFFGAAAGSSNTTGQANIFVGASAGISNTTGNRNVAIGYISGLLNVTGIDNVFLGSNAGRASTGSNNTFLGSFTADQLTSGNSNIFIGAYTGANATTGDNNILMGYGVSGNISATASNQLNINNWIYGNSGNIGLGSSASNPSQRLDVANGAVRVRDINTNTGGGSDKIVVADIDGVLKTVDRSTLISAPAIRTETNNYTALAADETILVDASSGAVVITLPAASSALGKKYSVKKIDASSNGVNVVSAGGTIDGNAAGTGVTGTLSWQGWVFQSDGTNWFIISRI